MPNLQPVLLERLAAAVRGDLPRLTPREVHLPAVPGKAFAVTGPRRAGKTSFMWQQLAGRLAAGRPRESLVLLGLEDDRFAGLGVADLDWLLEEYFSRYPRFRGTEEVTLCLDEVQVVPGWERFVRRVLDTEKVALLVSGSSARLLSREVATSLRGRGLEVRVLPFGFREALRHAGEEPDLAWDELGADGRSALGYHFRAWLETGGFPEVHALAPPDRNAVLSGYVDVMVLRDVIERHEVRNPHALRWLLRRLLAAPGQGFSVNGLFAEARAEGLAVGKDTLHDFVAHLEDCFLVRTVLLQGGPARRRVNLRKAYPVDPGLIALYAQPGDQSRARLETAVAIELERRGYEVTWVMTRDRGDAGLLGSGPGRERVLVQAGMDSRLDRLAAAATAHRARAHLVTLDLTRPPRVPEGVTWTPAPAWFLQR